MSSIKDTTTAIGNQVAHALSHIVADQMLAGARTKLKSHYAENDGSGTYTLVLKSKECSAKFQITLKQPGSTAAVPAYRSR